MFLSCCYFILGATTETNESNSAIAFTSLSQEEQKRQTVIHELISTEETYMEDMSIVTEVNHLLKKKEILVFFAIKNNYRCV